MALIELQCTECHQAFQRSTTKLRPKRLRDSTIVFCTAECYLQYQRKQFDATYEDRFYDKVDTQGPTRVHMDTRCWLWTGTLDDKGYGRLRNCRKWVASHRQAWIFYNSKQPEQMVLHKCNVKACVNPLHLYDGSHEDNMRDIQLANQRAREANENL